MSKIVGLNGLPLAMGADGTTALSDVIVPEIFTPYVQNRTKELSRLLGSGAAVLDPSIAGMLAGGGNTFTLPFFKDLDNDEEDVMSDDAPGVNDSTPKKIKAGEEVAVRLARHQSWSSNNLVAELINADPMAAIGDRVAAYWDRRDQATFIATAKGVFANNATATDAHHVKDDMLHDVSGSAYSAGVTSFTANAFIDTVLTMGDSMEDLTLICVHSIVYGRMMKNNLIQFIPDARGEVNIPTFLGRRVIVDDGMPMPEAGKFETWLFGRGAFRINYGTFDKPTELARAAAAGKGAGADILHNRRVLTLHPTGYAYKGAATKGGPANSVLAAAASWERAYPERKQIAMAKLITREFAGPSAP